jgi:hypothetical protein
MREVAWDLAFLGLNAAITVYFGTMNWTVLSVLTGFCAAGCGVAAVWHYRLAKQRD